MTCKITCPDCNKEIILDIVQNVKGQLEVSQTQKPSSPTTDGTYTVETGLSSLVNTEQASKMKTGINITGTVERKTQTRTINLKSGGTLDTCDAFLCDQAGEITMQLWGADVNKVSDGTQIRIENGYTNTFKGETALTKGKYGKLEILS